MADTDTYDYFAEDAISTDEFGRVLPRAKRKGERALWSSNDHAAWDPDEPRATDNGDSDG